MKLVEKLEQAAVDKAKIVKPIKPKKPIKPNRVYEEHRGYTDDGKLLKDVLQEIATAANVTIADVIERAFYDCEHDYDYSREDIVYRIYESDDKYNARMATYDAEFKAYEDALAIYTSWMETYGSDEIKARNNAKEAKRKKKADAEREKLMKERNRIDRMLANIK